MTNNFLKLLLGCAIMLLIGWIVWSHHTSDDDTTTITAPAADLAAIRMNDSLLRVNAQQKEDMDRQNQIIRAKDEALTLSIDNAVKWQKAYVKARNERNDAQALLFGDTLAAATGDLAESSLDFQQEAGEFIVMAEDKNRTTQIKDSLQTAMLSDMRIKIDSTINAYNQRAKTSKKEINQKRKSAFIAGGAVGIALGIMVAAAVH